MELYAYSKFWSLRWCTCGWAIMYETNGWINMLNSNTNQYIERRECSTETFTSQILHHYGSEHYECNLCQFCGNIDNIETQKNMQSKLDISWSARHNAIKKQVIRTRVCFYFFAIALGCPDHTKILLHQKVFCSFILIITIWWERYW